MPVLRGISGENGFVGRHWRFMTVVESATRTEFARFSMFHSSSPLLISVHRRALAVQLDGFKLHGSR
ncbi:MAG: hypothetical protein B7X55_00725 [Rhodobacterales bacterium 34-62-10]|jgi:citrate synthase|nr:MAG: hypothetical protein B7X55_00725 [Rhodobacterales bacterium 34-62-10]|tara:strand:+ start:354 stop:554 length:201 start_codon:yes stop_codon:yes gene_type:complete